MVQPVLAVDIGGTKIRFALFDQSHRLFHEEQIPTPPLGAENILAAIIGFVNRNRNAIGAIGIAAAGVIHPETGMVISASDSIKNWSGFALKAQVQAATGLPTVVENDVNAFLLGELDQGRYEKNSALGIMLGTGVGGAAILTGKLWRGQRGAACEIGHFPGFGSLPCTCGQAGHLEAWAGGRAILRNYLHLQKPSQKNRVKSTAEVAKLAEKGDEKALEVFRQAGAALGLGISVFATMFDIENVIIGGSVIQSWSLLKASCEEALLDNPPVSGIKPQINLAQIGDQAVLYGAARQARQLCS